MEAGYSIYIMYVYLYYMSDEHLPGVAIETCSLRSARLGDQAGIRFCPCTVRTEYSTSRINA